MKLFGLTGGIGTGKSTAAIFLAKRGVAVVDTDVLARAAVEPGQPALARIVECFGNEVLDNRGVLKRSALAEVVFTQPERLKELEGILHPIIRERWTTQVEQWRQEGREVAAVVIPLLFETGAESQFDLILCTACSKRTQHERLAARGWSDEQIARRIASQWPLEKKIAASHRVIWTEGDLAIHERQIDTVLEHYLASRR